MCVFCLTKCFSRKYDEEENNFVELNEIGSDKIIIPDSNRSDKTTNPNDKNADKKNKFDETALLLNNYLLRNEVRYLFGNMKNNFYSYKKGEMVNNLKDNIDNHILKEYYFNLVLDNSKRRKELAYKTCEIITNYIEYNKTNNFINNLKEWKENDIQNKFKTSGVLQKLIYYLSADKGSEIYLD